MALPDPAAVISQSVSALQHESTKWPEPSSHFGLTTISGNGSKACWVTSIASRWGKLYWSQLMLAQNPLLRTVAAKFNLSGTDPVQVQRADSDLQAVPYRKAMSKLRQHNNNTVLFVLVHDSPC